MGCQERRFDFRPRGRISDRDGNALSSRNAASAGCGLDSVRLYLAEEGAVSFLGATCGAVRDWLRPTARTLGCTECRDTARSAVSHAQEFEHVWGIRSARIHGLGENVALPHEGLLSRSVEAGRRSDQPG